jgi:hypothetical protein
MLPGARIERRLLFRYALSWAHNGKRAARSDKGREPAERRLERQMMDRGDRSHQIEPGFLQVRSHDVAAHQGHVGAVGNPVGGPGERRFVRIDPHDLRAAIRQLGEEEPLTASDVERAVTRRRGRIEHRLVVGDVVVPRRWAVGAHARSLACSLLHSLDAGPRVLEASDASVPALPGWPHD